MRFRRVGCKSQNWGLTRAIRGYVVRENAGVGGKATKWVLAKQLLPRDTNEVFDTDDFYIAKFGNKNGRIEIYSELFNNQLGTRLGFEMAHSGIARLDGVLYFVTKSFRSKDDLVHGSLMIEQVFSAKGATDLVKAREEQAFYSVDFLHHVFLEYCGKSDGESAFEKFVEMLVFDALIGSMDRHSQNWGVLKSQVLDGTRVERCRFSPIFDSARALLWDLPEAKLLLYDLDNTELERYVIKSKPCIGPPRNHPKVNNCNHLDFFKSLLELYPHQTLKAYAKIPADIDQVVMPILREFPFRRVFSPLRRRMILKLLRIRADRLKKVFEEGGAHENTIGISTTAL